MARRILIMDQEGCAVDVGVRARLAGWDVRYWNTVDKKQYDLPPGSGFFPIIDDFNEIKNKWLDWADLIYLPYNDFYMDMLEPYRQKGYPIHGSNRASADLERDRFLGQKLMADSGIPVMDSREFHDYGQAAQFVLKHPEFLVSKPSGNMGKELSYVAHSVRDMCYMLDKWSHNPVLKAAAKKTGFILQEKKIGTEMAVGGFFGPHGWNKYFYENFEYKKMMNDDLGPNTGEMGTLSRMTKKSKLADRLLLPLTEKLLEIGYVGYVDNNAIIDEYGDPWPMEITTRDGWPTKFNVTAHVKNSDPIQWMLDLVNGEDTMECIDSEVCVSVVMCVHVSSVDAVPEGIPILDIDDFSNVHLYNARSGKVPYLEGNKLTYIDGIVTCGREPIIVTGVGKTISEARRNCYNRVKNIHICKSPFYRTDIGAGRMKKQLPILHKHGYAKGLEF